MNWLYLGIVPIAVALISAGYFKEEVVSLLTAGPNYTGFTYQAEDKQRKHAIFEEDWKFSTVGNLAYAVVTPRDMPGARWKYRGFQKGQFMSLSYQSTDPTRSGVGAVYLKRSGNTSEWHSYIMANDCTLEEAVRCPYVLVPASAASQARTKYKDDLSQTCETLFKLDSCKATSPDVVAK